MGLIELTDLYNSDKRFKAYVDKYMGCHPEKDNNLSTILRLKLVQEYALYLKGCDSNA